MTMRNGEWNAQAELAMMGFTISITSQEHLNYMVKYVLNTLKDEYQYDVVEKTNEVVTDAINKYSSKKVADRNVYWFTCNTTVFGTCLTFVRDKGALTLKSGEMKPSGSLAWVENLDAPDCSELGYVFFENRNGKIRRIG